jgi:hypothetical protein
MQTFKTHPRTVEAVQVTAGMISGEEEMPPGAKKRRRDDSLTILMPAGRNYQWAEAREGMWLIPVASGQSRIKTYERPLTDEEFKARYEPA